MEELDEWAQFDLDEPIGPRESRIQLAEIAAMYANSRLPKGQKPFVRADFLHVSRQQYQEAQENNLIAGLRAIATKPSDRRKSKRRQARRAKAVRK